MTADPQERQVVELIERWRQRARQSCNANGRLNRAGSATMDCAADLVAAMKAPKNPDPRCPKCGFTMCELADYRELTPLVSTATPNGTYRCFHCSGVQAENQR